MNRKGRTKEFPPIDMEELHRQHRELQAICVVGEVAKTLALLDERYLRMVEADIAQLREKRRRAAEPEPPETVDPLAKAM